MFKQLELKFFINNDLRIKNGSANQPTDQKRDQIGEFGTDDSSWNALSVRFARVFIAL